MKIRELFEDNKEGLLSIFFTAGYPELDSTELIAEYLDNAGVKMVEIGMPFSDPLADGPTIQKSSEVALKNGMNIHIMFDQLERISRATDLTIILMGYFNQLLAIGVEDFLKNCQASGVAGLIIPDLPMDIYESTYMDLFKKYNMAISFLITPGTSRERILMADRLSTGFLYLVADNSTTGNTSGAISDSQIAYFRKIKELNLSTPKLIGFGIKSAEQIEFVKKFADGVIVGSEFIRQISASEYISQNRISNFINNLETSD